MSCTRLLLKISPVREKFFTLFTDKPYVVTYTYKRRIPKESDESLNIYIPSYRYEFTKERTFDYHTQRDANLQIDAIKRGKCFKCGDVRNCTKFLNKFLHGGYDWK